LSSRQQTRIGVAPPLGTLVLADAPPRVGRLVQLGRATADRRPRRLGQPCDPADPAIAQCPGRRAEQQPTLPLGQMRRDQGEGRRQKVKAAISELLARRPYYGKRIGGDVGQGARPGQAERGAMGIIQSRTRQIRCYWYRWIIEGGMTKS
jgi:hypothetical protein